MISRAAEWGISSKEVEELRDEISIIKMRGDIDMSNKLPESVLNRYPQLQNIFESIELFKKSGKQEVKCQSCGNTIEMRKNKKDESLETNCTCGKSKYRMRWDTNKESPNYFTDLIYFF